jgi:hypothetical protein
VSDLITIGQVTQIGPPFAAVFAGLPAAEQQALVSDASAVVEDWCRRIFAQQTYTETYDGEGLPRIWLRQRPVLAVAAVLVNGDALDNTYLSAWMFNGDTGMLIRGNGLDDDRFPAWFPRGSRNIQVTYSAGYLTVPRPVQRATILAVRYLYEMGRRTWFALSETIGDYSYTQAALPTMTYALPPAITGLLAPYVQDDGPL